MRATLLVAFVVATVSPSHAAPAADVVIAWSPTPLGPVGEAIADAASRAGASYIDQSPEAVPLPDPRALIKHGVQAYGSLEFDAALTALDTAAEIVDQTGAANVDTTQLGDLFLYRALAQTTRGEDARSWDDLVIVAGIDPARVLDPANIPPRAVERFAQARAHVAAVPRGKVALKGPRGCRVRIDGAIVTTRELELPFGRHWLEAVCPGVEPVRRRVLVDRVAFEVPIAGAPIAPPEDAALLIQGRSAAARALVIVTIQGQTAVIRKLGIDGKERDRTTVTLRGGDRDRRAVGAAVAGVLAPPPVIPDAPWYKSRWVWAGAGAVIVGAILVPLAISGSGSAPEPVVRPEGVDF